jgi:hypothetical protein
MGKHDSDSDRFGFDFGGPAKARIRYVEKISNNFDLLHSRWIHHHITMRNNLWYAIIRYRAAKMHNWRFIKKPFNHCGRRVSAA